MNFAAITGFETVLLQGAATVASTFNVTGLSDQTWLRIYGQSSVIITATTTMGSNLTSTFDSIATALGGATQ